MNTINEVASQEKQYWAGLARATDRVFNSHPNIDDHRNRHPWAIGAHGNPNSGIWFVGENPSLTQVERVRDPDGGPPTIEAQWWSSRGDKLFRMMLVKYGFKQGTIESPGGWNCYITNVIKQADYTREWREKTQESRNWAAETWASVLAWELENSKPRLVVFMGRQTEILLTYLISIGRIRLPRTERITHYAYIGQRAEGHLGPMHPQRIQAYDKEFSQIRELFNMLSVR